MVPRAVSTAALPVACKRQSLHVPRIPGAGPFTATVTRSSATLTRTTAVSPAFHDLGGFSPCGGARGGPGGFLVAHGRHPGSCGREQNGQEQDETGHHHGRFHRDRSGIRMSWWVLRLSLWGFGAIMHRHGS